MILRRIARPMLAAIFVSGGIQSLRNPKQPTQAVEPFLDKTVGQVRDKVPEQVPTDAESLVKLDAAIKVGAGLALALGKFPRLSAALLAGSLIPTTAAAHRFWESEDPGERAQQQIHFFKNVSLLGGLLIAAADTHGKPSLNWQAHHAARIAGAKLHRTTDDVQGTLAHAAGAVQGAVQSAAGTAQGKAKSLLPR
ncbi:DoxX family protein [Actinophytocola gossypii]|uniref:DoxX family protein n=1 Tax=Actinophytocola gossypii TaxID=2812003 RepID=A0ABT2JGM5_9PSEU|nr:DoxX family protein [Actinophytocola gossypii]MCT2587008.1 DoxX family protein [Actinophytocola gossypii]